MHQVAIWDAINDYAAACGGDTSKATISPWRMRAVANVERLLLSYFAALEEIAELEGDCENQQFKLTRFQASQIARKALHKAEPPK